MTPASDACLQATDYFLWALQRLFEREEERYWEYVWPSVAVVHDIDDVSRLWTILHSKELSDVQHAQKESRGYRATQRTE
jgi:hypothetical protein